MDCKDHGHGSTNKGYASVWIVKLQKTVRLHRVVYCLENKVPLESIKGLSVRHTCDNPRCIEPTHLILGTHKDNMEDKVLRGRTPKTQPNQHKITDAQVLEIRDVYVKGSRTYGAPALARIYGVHQSLINRIANRDIR